MKVVIDTNVLVSALISPDGIPGRIIRALELFTFVWSKELRAELERVLQYDHIVTRYALTYEGRQAYLSLLDKNVSLVVLERQIDRTSRDPDDDKFLACAIAGSADYLVSGDRHLLELGRFGNVQILTPSEFHAILQE